MHLFQAPATAVDAEGLTGLMHAATADALTKAGAQLKPFLNVGMLPFALMDKAAASR